MSDEKGTPPDPPAEQPPKLRMVDNRKNKNDPLTVAVYEKIWETYRDLPRRSAHELARQAGINYKTALKAINLGWPTRGWPSLSERAKMWDKGLQEANDKPLSPKQVIDLERFLNIKEGVLNGAMSIRSMGAILFKRILPAVDAAVMTRTYRRHRIIHEQRGKRVVERHVQEDIELPPYLPHLASAARDVSAMLSAAQEIERVWAKIVPPEGVEADAGGWESLTEEQHRYIIDNGGRLPPGVTAERLRRG